MRQILFILLALLCTFTQVSAQPGQSSVITLVFPYGSRSIAMGETFTGIADNNETMYYNPAGLGQSPLANTWKKYKLPTSSSVTAVSSPARAAFDLSAVNIYAGTESGEIFLHNGHIWKDYKTYALREEDDDLRAVAKRFVNTDNDTLIRKSINKIRRFNEINLKRTAACKDIIKDHIKKDSSGKFMTDPFFLAGKIADINAGSKDTMSVYKELSSYIDTSVTDSLAGEVMSIFSIEDKVIESMLDIKIPMNVTIDEPITAIAVDASSTLWVGTNNGLWEFDEHSWSKHDITNNLCSNTILDITTYINKVGVSTDKGCSILDGNWVSYTYRSDFITDTVTSMDFGKDEEYFLGTRDGVVHIKEGKSSIIDTSNGLLSNNVTAILYDDENRLWVGTQGGVTRMGENSVKKFKFPGSIVNNLAEHRNTIWLATDNGAVRYNEPAGNENLPEWKIYHSKNTLSGDNIIDVATYSKDVWVLSDKGVDHYKKGKIEITPFYEKVLPDLGLDDIWHGALSGTFPIENVGTVGFFLNLLDFGEIPATDIYGREERTYDSYELVFGLSYGLGITDNFSTGLNIKYVKSALAEGLDVDNPTAGVGRNFALDAGLLAQNLFIDRLNLGFMMQNMGPPIYYVEKSNSDPIPFTLRLGLSYNPVHTPNHDLIAAVDFEKEFVKNHIYEDPDPFWKALITSITDDPWEEELKAVQVHLGIEYTYLYFLSMRLGLLWDELGARQEVHGGFGIEYGDLGVDMSMIFDLRDEGIRDKQWSVSLTYSR